MVTKQSFSSLVAIVNKKKFPSTFWQRGRPHPKPSVSLLHCTGPVDGFRMTNLWFTERDQIS